MSDFDQRALAANFESWKRERMPTEENPVAFELYAIGSILTDQDLSDDDIDFGHIGGMDDGGVDGAYVFVDGALVRDEDQNLSGQYQMVDLVLIQVKQSGGFSENVFGQIASYVRDVLNWDEPVERLIHLNTEAREFIHLFRTTFDKLLASSLFQVGRLKVSLPHTK